MQSPSNKKFSLYFLFLLVLIGIAATNKSDKVDSTLNNKFFNSKYFDKVLLMQIKDSLYAGNTEVSNGMYRTFIEDLKKKGDIEKSNLYAVDSMKWGDKHFYNEPYITYYYSHPAYINYPVVNVSYSGATAFCEWLTEKYNTYPKRKFKKIRFRLPTEKEWVYAAKGGLDSVVFPWGYTSLRNIKGETLCNFFRINDACIKRNRETGEIVLDCSSYISITDWGADITTPVYSYWPNGYGLYNVCGNVAEMLLEKGRTKGGSWHSSGYYMRIDSEDEYQGFTEPSPMIGFRVFMDVIEK